MRRRSGLTLGELLVLCIVILVIAAFAVPGFLSGRRASNEREVFTTLKTVSSAEADFRANDRDWNGVNDFWTADVKGLYTMTPAGVRGSGDLAIRLIDLKTAASDGDDTFYPAGGENLPLSRFADPAPRSGYWSLALLTDLQLKGFPEMNYKEDTLGAPPMGSIHNTSKFGFIGFPDSPSAGKYLFLINENNTVFRSALTGSPRSGRSVPPGLRGVPPNYLHWPADVELKSYWSKPS